MPSRIRVPAHFARDRDCLQWVAGTAGREDPTHVTYGWILNTLAIDRVAISRTLRTHIEKDSQVQVEEEFEARWDDSGNLVSPFPPP